MTRIHHGLGADLEWINVSVWRRCPICGGDAGCKTHAEGNFAACGKRPSDWPMTSGAWLHRVLPPFARMTTKSDPQASLMPSPSAAGTVS
jgi:hypothetical protein